MSSPKVIVQILVVGAQIFGRAFVAAARQAVKNAQARPAAGMGTDVAGVGNATSGSATDQLTREHRMTLDEAHLILNSKKGESVENIIRNYEHLFKINSPPPMPTTQASGRSKPTYWSHYLQSKVVCARARIEAELKVADKEVPLESTPKEPGPPPPSS